VRPDLSIVIPTCNRRESVLRLLKALAADANAVAFEVIVVDDGSRDDTVACLQSLSPPFPLQICAERAGGPSRARNAGATRARSEILLFLDDDVEPMAGTLARHVEFHREHRARLGIGDLPPAVSDTSFIGVTLRGWWDRMLDEIRKPGHRFSFRNVLTGHLSIRRDHFVALGGFDPELQCHEDWEFGYRALQHDLRLGYVAGAVAWHHDTSRLDKILHRKFEEGIADVQLARKYPELAPAFPLSRPPASSAGRLLLRVAWSPRLSAIAARACRARMHTYEYLRLRGRWRRMLDALLMLHYWSGVASVVPARRDLAFVNSPPLASAEVVIDLAEGLDRAERWLDATTPASATLYFGEHPLGYWDDVPGAEPLRGEHLRPLLAMPHWRRRLATALVSARALPPVLSPLAASADTRRHVPHVGAPVVRDVHLPAHLAAAVDAQQRSPIPPVQDVPRVHLAHDDANVVVARPQRQHGADELDFSASRVGNDGVVSA
jgi:GT2 family glycosyltransferase